MAEKKGKNPKHHIEQNKTKISDSAEKETNLSDVFLDELKWTFDKFEELTENERIKMYGKNEYMEQFRSYFKERHPNLLDKIDNAKLLQKINDKEWVEQKYMPIYLQVLEKKWFHLADMIKKPGTLNKEFGPEDTEKHVMEISLKKLHSFCDESSNKIAPDVFSKFASFAGFHPTTYIINDDGKLKTIDDLYPMWNDFLKKEKISFSDQTESKIANILLPEYNPTERIIVEIALNKIRKELTWKLRANFDERFGYPIKIDIFSPYQDIITFRDEWKSFLDEHQTEISENLAKKLDAIIVSNGDIQKVLLVSGKKFDDTRWFSEREQYFRRIFNKLATRQLFDELKKTEESIDHYIEAMGKTFKEFPPYVNDILNMDIYRFNAKNINTIDTTLEIDLQNINDQITDLNKQALTATDAERKILRDKAKALKQEREHRRWQAYIAFLRTKNPDLADVFAQLVTSKFDFTTLSADHQQILVNVLVKNKLEDTIKNKVPELLSVTEEKLTQFVNDLFDLKKMDITIPTRTSGLIPLSFVKKEFMSSFHKQLPSLDTLERDIKNLPLNFVTQLTESNAAFFEDSPIFDSLYTDFSARNWSFRLNDAYKVRIKKDGKIVEWYLSSYCPIDEKYNDEDYNWWELFLYSEPITSPNQNRELVTRPHDADKTAIPVVIKTDEQPQCDMEVLDRKINLNGDAFWALLFWYVLGQESMAQTMSPAKEKELGKKLGKLNVYKEKEEWEEEEPEPVTEKSETVTEISEKKKFLNERSQLKWYGFPEPQYNVKDKENYGFVKWTRLLIPFTESEVEPLQAWGKAWLQMEITDIDEKKWTFTTKIHGGELGLGKYEWQKKEMPINSESIATIKNIFWDNIYKFPANSQHGRAEQMAMIDWSVASDLEKSFGSLELKWGDFVFTLGDQKGEKVTHFGRYEQGIGERHDQELWTSVLYKVKHNSNKTFTVTGERKNKDTHTIYSSRDMDYANFMIFIKEKWLQPKTKKQAETMEKKSIWEDKETAKTVRWFSINNVLGFFKNSFSKVKDSIKKYDDERTEDLTDLLTSQGKLYSAIGSFLPFARISAWFETMGAEYFLERDSRIWKKVEKRKKFYEDADFSLIYDTIIKPMLLWGATIKPHYKIAAILLAIIAKGKWPYSKNPEFAAKGMRVNVLMWPAHQQRYLNMREKLTRELEQGSAAYGSIWTDNKKNEILELEMKYIVHVMDGRQLGIQDGDKTKLYFYGKYSKTFIDELEKWYTWFFSQSMVDEWFSKNKNASFEFARGEFFRLLSDRPQQAIPFLKVMATKAVSPGQWKTFEMAVMAGMLSGIFLTMTMSETQWMIKNVCRTRWFVPGIRVKDIKQQTKLQRMLDIFSGGKFSATWYNPKNFSYRDISWWTKKFTKRDDKDPWIFQKWISKGNTLDELSNFFKLKGKTESGKTLLDIYTDSKTSPSDKALLQEFLNNSNEKDESLDPDVSKNPYALSWSILTKSQSVVQQMMKIDSGGFATKDGDEKQSMQGFFDDMQKEIPRDTLTSPEQVKFFVDKFFNWFGEKWFSLNKKTELIKRLKWCQQNPNKKEVNDVLYYSIVGEICSSFGHAHIPDQFQNALLVRKDFFKNNLNTILEPNILIHSFGSPSYKNDYDKYEPILEPREDCVKLLDKDLRQAYMYGLPQDQKKLVNQGLVKLKKENYLNFRLYDLAEKMYRDTGLPNRFKDSADSESRVAPKKTTSAKATWAKIKNAQVIDKVRAILEGKPIIDSEEDNELPPEYEDDTYYYNE